MGIKSMAVDMSGADQDQEPTRLSRMKLTEKEKARLKEMIKNADSLQEIMRLEKMLNEGSLPPGVHIDTDAMEE